MITAREAARLSALHAVGLIDTAPTEAFDRITRLAASLFGAPIALVSLIDRDRQWFKSKIGLDATELRRCDSLCDHAIRSDGVLAVPDLSRDARFAGNPLVVGPPHLRFYAGVPLVTRAGHAVGAVCIAGPQQRHLSGAEQRSLIDLAALATAEIELHAATNQRSAVTGLPNRAQLLRHLADAVPNERWVLAVANLADAVRLTDLLSALGADRQDELIRMGAAALAAALPPGQTLYHVGTARFAMLLPSATHIATLTRLTEAMRAPIHCGQVPVFLDVGIGAVPFRSGSAVPMDLLRTALAAAQRARQDGDTTTWLMYDAKTDRAHRRAFQLLTDLRPALDGAAGDGVGHAGPSGLPPSRRPGTHAPQLDLHYQPRIDLRSGRCSGVEALMRWQHPTLGGVPPSEFIPLVEKTALPRAMTAWVLETALSDAAAWRRSGLDLNVSVNVCALNMGEHDFDRRVAAALARHGIPPGILELELTETALLHGARLRRTMREITGLGVSLAIDDFGTGYSNLAYLRKIPARVLKLDRSFVRTLPDVARDRTIVRSLIGMAHDLGYRVVAEGVETAETLDLLREWDCDEAQGFLFARAMPVDALTDWITDQPPSGFARTPADMVPGTVPELLAGRVAA